MRRYVGAALLVSHLAGAGAAAQTVSATMGAIDGRVTDNTNAVLPGVTVTISGPAMMGTRGATTNDQGAYRIAAVPPGDYAVLFTLDGFAPLKRTEIRVDLGFTATLNVRMAVGTVEANVTVTGASPVVDVASTRVTTTFDAPMLASIPSGSRDYWALLSETPALKLTRVDVGGSSAGSQSSYYAYGTHRPESADDRRDQFDTGHRTVATISTSDQRAFDSEHQLELGQFVRATARHRAAASVAHRRQAGLVK